MSLVRVFHFGFNAKNLGGENSSSMPYRPSFLIGESHR